MATIHANPTELETAKTDNPPSVSTGEKLRHAFLINLYWQLLKGNLTLWMLRHAPVTDPETDSAEYAQYEDERDLVRAEIASRQARGRGK